MILTVLSSIVETDAFRVGAVLLPISMFILRLGKKLKKIFKAHKTKLLIWAVVTIVLFGVTTFLSYKIYDGNPQFRFISFEILFFLFGIAQFFTMRKIFPNLSADLKSFWPEFLFTLAFLCIGSIAFFSCIERLEPLYRWNYLVALIWFTIPFLVYKLYEFAFLIPAPNIIKWVHNGDRSFPTEFLLPIIINLELIKIEDGQTKSLSLKMETSEETLFGDFFRHTINDIRENKNIEIAIYNEHNEHYEWVFSTKLFWIFKRRIDFSKSIKDNRINKNATIICERL